MHMQADMHMDGDMHMEGTTILRSSSLRQQSATKPAPASTPEDGLLATDMALDTDDDHHQEGSRRRPVGRAYRLVAVAPAKLVGSPSRRRLQRIPDHDEAADGHQHHHDD